MATTSPPKPPRRPRSAENTQTTFLDAAERLFGERGYEATAIRAIAEHAGANLGALHYYWGSKEALFEATCERRLRPVAEERLQRLDACLVRAAGGAPELRQVLEAFIMPALLHPDQPEAERIQVGRLLACLSSSAAPEVQRIRSAIIDETSLRFVRLLRQACAGLDDESFYWRLHAVFGTLQYAMGGSDRIRRLSHGKFDGRDQRQGIEEFITGLCALLAAPPLGTPALKPAAATRRPASTSRARKVASS